jgi:hypothetical protein
MCLGGYRIGGEAVVVVRIGTWNLENLFRPAGGADPATDADYQAKLTALTTRHRRDGT